MPSFSVDAGDFNPGPCVSTASSHTTEPLLALAFIFKIFKFNFFVTFITYIYVCLSSVCIAGTWGIQESFRYSGAGLTGGFGMSEWGVENCVPIIWKSNKHFNHWPISLAPKFNLFILRRWSLLYGSWTHKELPVSKVLESRVCAIVRSNILVILTAMSSLWDCNIYYI